MSETRHELRSFNPDDRVGKLESRIENLEERMHKREKFESFLLGVAAAIGVVGGYLLKWLKGEQ